jgi:ribose 5-phosphate isomerase A
MTDGDDRAAAKRAAGQAAAETVQDGDVVGLGSGSTATHAIEALGRAVDAGLDVVGVPTSYQSRSLAIQAGIPLADLDEVGVDVAIDGADQVAEGTLIKGGGAAHAREKVIDASADRFVAVVDPAKQAEVLDDPVPVEVLPMARPTVADAIRELGGEPTLRAADRKSGPVVTDNGNLLLDADFGPIDAPESLAADLAGLPGLVAHGLFVDLVDEVVVGHPDGSVERRTIDAATTE